MKTTNTTYSKENGTCCICGRKTKGLRLDKDNKNFCYEHKAQMNGNKVVEFDQDFLAEFGL